MLHRAAHRARLAGAQLFLRQQARLRIQKRGLFAQIYRVLIEVCVPDFLVSILRLRRIRFQLRDFILHAHSGCKIVRQQARRVVCRPPALERSVRVCKRRLLLLPGKFLRFELFHCLLRRRFRALGCLHIVRRLAHILLGLPDISKNPLCPLHSLGYLGIGSKRSRLLFFRRLLCLVQTAPCREQRRQRRLLCCKLACRGLCKARRVRIPAMRRLNLVCSVNPRNQFLCLLYAGLLCPALCQRLLRRLAFGKGLKQRPRCLHSVAGPVSRLTGGLRPHLRGFTVLFLLFTKPLQPLEQLLQIRDAQLVRRKDAIPHRDQMLGIRIRGRQLDMAYLGLARCPELCKFALLPAAALRQFPDHFFIQTGSEQFAKNLFLLIGLGAQQFHELALRNHRHLHELALGQADDLRNFRICLPCVSSVFRAVRQGQRDSFVFLFYAMSPPQRADVSGYPANRVRPFRFGKAEFHKRCHRIAHKLTLQLGAAFAVAFRAGLAIQGKNDRVENRRFTRTGVAGDQKQVLIRHSKIDLGLFAVRAERLHSQLQWPHFTPPPARS